MSSSTGKPELSPLKQALVALEAMQAKLDAAERRRNEPIAIVGMGCRFPDGANNPGLFWERLRDGVNSISEIPASRWDVDAHFDANPDAPGKMYTRWAGLLDTVDLFEPQFFGIAPREAVYMDPQQRLLLEVAWEAFEDAGQAPDLLHGTKAGVFFGLCTTDYANILGADRDLTSIDTYSQSGLAHSMASGRVSYVFGLHGPSMTLDTACSSSLVAVHLACQSLRAEECRVALAGGAHLILTPENSVAFSRTRMAAADGRCKTFDASADGFVEGEGCGIIVLKRLSDAVADRDRVLAVIRGSAVNQDGPSSGLTAPNGPAQEAVLRDALASAGLRPAEVDYIEAHGTGTPLGDPIEVQALGAVFGEGRAADRPLLIGSVKTNFGHLQASAGIAGLIKLVLAMQHEQLPAHLNFSVPNPHVPWAQLPVKVTSTSTPWPAAGRRRAAGVSSFGFSGTNAHVVIQEAPPRAAEPRGPEPPMHLLTLSANSETALVAQAARWSTVLAGASESSLADICYTANVGRSHLAYRLAVIVTSCQQASAQLAQIAAGQPSREVARGHVASSDRLKVAFLFTGQGSQYAGMGRQLYETQPTFHAAMDRCDAALRGVLDRPLLSVIYPEQADDSAIDKTAYTQPALFALEYALAELWRSWGVRPGAVLGHSIGEYVAAVQAGVFDLDRAIALVATRGRLMQSLPAGGAMAAVLADEPTVRRALGTHGGGVAIAAVNGPRNIVISGPAPAVDQALAHLDSIGVTAERLTVSHAFHSALMDPILDAFERAAASAQPGQANLAFVSNLTGKLARKEFADPQYWRRHLREPVLFAAGASSLYDQGYRVFVEMGPRPVLSGMAQRAIAAKDATWLASLRQGRDDWSQMLGALAQLYVRGAAIDWNGVHRDYARCKQSMPTYPFERARYWLPRLKPAEPVRGRATGHRLLGPAVRTALGQTVFSSAIGTDSHPFLMDHQKHGVAIFPATAYLEMGMAAARETLGRGTHVFEELVINEPLTVGTEDVNVQVIVSPAEHGASTFQLFSQEATQWREHAVGILRAAPEPPAAADDLDAVRARCAEPQPLENYYETMLADGHGYGPAFQGIVGLWRGQLEALGRVELPEMVKGDASAYRLHPVLLDASIQILSAGVPDELKGKSTGETFLPVSLGRFRVYLDGADRAWSHVRLRDLEPDGFVCDVRLYDDAGRVIAEVVDVYHRRARVSAPRTAPSLCEVAWRLKPHDTGHDTKADHAGVWLLVGHRDSFTSGLADRLTARARRPIVVELGNAFRPLDASGHMTIDASDPEQFRRMLADVPVSAGPLQGVVHLAGVGPAAPIPADGNPADAGVASVSASLRTGAESLLYLSQALGAAEADNPPRFWVLTSGAVTVSDSPRPIEFTKAPLWGLGRTVAVEHPDLRCTVADLDPRAPEADLDRVCEEVLRSGPETQLAFRDGLRYVARLVPGEWPAVAAGEPGTAQPLTLTITERGTLDKLALVEAPRRAPAAGEVEVAVVAAGLNFRDVLNALGMYEGPAGPLGGECAGRVVAVGAGVESLKPGDDVMGMALATFSNFVTAPAAGFIRKPANLDMEAAATIPMTFLTAELGLNRLAKMKAGDRVLIHAAAGGVGVACVRLAQRAGAEIYATAGSPEKHAFLKSLGVKHVMSSRSLDFAEEIQRLTHGEGVDIVMNSLAGDFIEKSLSVMRQGGRFLEIGRAGIWTAEQMAAVRPDVEYFPILLRHDHLELIQSMLQDLAAAFESGELTPLPRRTFALTNAVDAFRYMAQARHIGKVVLSIDRLEPPAPALRADASYLVTGGLGALGLNVARWMVAGGARHVVLTSRSAPTAEASQAISQLETAGAVVRVIRADVSSAVDVNRLIDDISAHLPPLAGVIHAAGVVDDGMLQQQTWPRFERVFGPKILGAWHLHQHTRESSLDFFVMFSSMVSILGGPGQGNYVAANGFLDALAHHRRESGLAGLSINWGPWQGDGMAGRVSQRDLARWAEQGHGLIQEDEGLAILGRLLTQPPAPQVAVLPVDWPKLFRHFPDRSEPRMLAELADRYARPASAAPVRKQRLADTLAAAPPNRRAPIVRAFVRDEALKVLGLDAATTVDPKQPLREFGLDSLMAVELRNVMAGAVERTLPATLLFKYPTIEALGDFVLESFDLGTAAASTPEADAETAAVESLSEDDVKKLLAEELAALSGADWMTEPEP
jgi:acyl transferase domain-containing protein/NADPH-dependent curcumin reductase CurA/short-subunit dehydrogenase/acyl carrier protein